MTPAIIAKLSQLQTCNSTLLKPFVQLSFLVSRYYCIITTSNTPVGTRYKLLASYNSIMTFLGSLLWGYQQTSNKIPSDKLVIVQDRASKNALQVA